MQHRATQVQRRAEVDFNATPMIDVIFILTVFFMLVSRFASAENVPMEIPRPIDSQAATQKIPDRIVLNCRPLDDDDPGVGVQYSIGPNRPQPLSELSRTLAAMKAQRRDLKVIIRADRRLRYGDVKPIIAMVASHDITMLNVAAQSGEGGAGAP